MGHYTSDFFSNFFGAFDLPPQFYENYVCGAQAKRAALVLLPRSNKLRAPLRRNYTGKINSDVAKSEITHFPTAKTNTNVSQLRLIRPCPRKVNI